MKSLALNLQQILNWLHETDPQTLKSLWVKANQIREASVGNAVHLRGLIEISNYCCRSCKYCGINAEKTNIERYRMTADEIVDCAHIAHSFGYGTVVLQAGEDYCLTTDFITDVIHRIKKTTSLAITLSLGERPHEDLVVWKKAGADRYLLRFETSSKELYELIHPAPKSQNNDRDRLDILQELREIGYEVGSGIMIGIPGQSFTSLAEDIQLFAKLDLDMIGVGPYLPDPNTPLGAGDIAPIIDPNEQVPNTELMTYKVVALTRIMCPTANIPSTTALATLNKATGRELGLQRGANIVMPNVTPPQYRSKYTIYPNKACLTEDATACHKCMCLRIESLGRTIGKGSGGRRRLG